MRYEKELDIVLREIMSGWDVPGLAVGIVQGGETIYSGFFGVQSLDTHVPVTPNSVFCTASVSKCFVATAVMRLVEAGRIELDAPVVHYLPYFHLDDDRCRRITIQQVLSHTSGMPDMDEFEYQDLVENPEWDEEAAERYVRALVGRRLVDEPGKRFYYSNIAYNVLGHLVAVVSGKPFEQTIREQLLLPAGMPDSTYLLEEVPQERLALPHLRSPEMCPSPFYPYHRADAPASFLHSTVSDMCRWGIVLLKRELLSVQSYAQMWTPVAERGTPPPSMYEEIGLGWTLGHYKGWRTVSHGGMGFGWADFFFLLPEKDCAGVVLCNQESDARTHIVHALADAMLGEPPQAGQVSWMVPVSRALMQGGLPAARARALELRTAGEDGLYNIDPDDLANLSLELHSAGRSDLAEGILELNLEFFPQHKYTAIQLARLRAHGG